MKCPRFVYGNRNDVHYKHAIWLNEFDHPKIATSKT